MHFTDLDKALQTTLSKARVKPFTLPMCPQIQLYLFDPSVLEGPISHDEAQKIVAEPAYWSFCWASGQVLAHFILENPDMVEGKRVLDFGTGSGVAAIAAAKAGAKEVIACDIDANALMAVAVNAQANGVLLQTLTDFAQLSEKIDLILAADVLYDRENYSVLDVFKERSNEIVLADSRVKSIPSNDFSKRATITSRTYPDLGEFEEFNQVRIYTWKKNQ